MGALFGTPKAPDTSKQEELQAKQEARLKRQEAQEQQQLTARLAARRSGGYRSLLSKGREDAMKGLSSNLGGQ